MTSRLFTPITLRDLKLANRIVVSPMCQYQAVNGAAQDWHLMNLGQYAMGAAGLVFAEATHVAPEARITHRCLGLWSDETEAALARVVNFCREHGVTALAVQLAHAGRKASCNPPLAGGKPLGQEQEAWTTVAPSPIPYDEGWHVPTALDLSGLARVKRQFVQAAKRAARLGFDVAEVHAAHGYLLSEFLSPLSNQRKDAYGGSRENRMRLLLEIFEAVRAVWPKASPLGVRISASEWVEGGWDLSDSVALAHELKAAGCDFLDVSSGGNHPKQAISLGPGYQVPFADRIKTETGITTMAVGMITEPRQAEDIIASGKADMVALARGMMFDPRWAWHAAEELGADTAYARQYARCHPSGRPQVFPVRQAAS